MSWLRGRRPEQEVDAGPEPPVNVRLVRETGEEVPLECVYVGQDSDGCHMWGAVMVVEHREGDSLRCDLLPAKTGVMVGMQFE